MLYTEKSVLRYYVRFSQIRSHLLIPGPRKLMGVLAMVGLGVATYATGSPITLTLPDLGANVLSTYCLYSDNLLPFRGHAIGS